jgi:hypothetical protein
MAREPVNFADLWERAVVMRINDVQVRVASIEDLIRMKRVADRPQDRLDVEALEEIRDRGSSDA